MTKATKGLLVSAVICLAVGGVINLDVVPVHLHDAFYAILPVGAVFLGMFLIARVLEKEVAHFDEEQGHSEHPGRAQTR